VAQVVLHEGDDALDAAGLIDAARDVDIIVADRLTEGPGEIFPRLPKLRAFVRCAVDIRNIDVEAASAGRSAGHARRPRFRTIRCGTGARLHGRPVARNFAATTDYHSVRKPEIVMGGSWPEAASASSVTAASANILPGSASRWAWGVLVADPFATVGDASIEQVPLEDLLERSDYVVCLAVANESTENLIGPGGPGADAAHAFFINLSPRQSRR